MSEMAVLAAEAESGDGGLAGFVTELVEKLGGPGAGLAVAAENLFPPIPSEVILPLAGFAAARGDLSLTSAIVWTTIGSVVGAVALYYVGVALGRDRLLAIAGKMPLIKISDVEKTEAWFNRHGVKAVFFGRMIPIFRSMISIPAGLERMPMPTFLLYTTLGSLIWNTLFILAGYFLGENWTRIEGWVGTYQKGVIVVCAIAAVAYLAFRIVKSRKEKAAAAALPPEPEQTSFRGTAAVPYPQPEPDRDPYAQEPYRRGAFPEDPQRPPAPGNWPR